MSEEIKSVITCDLDGKLEILLSSGGAPCCGYGAIRTGTNPVYDKLFSSYKVDANNNKANRSIHYL